MTALHARLRRLEGAHQHQPPPDMEAIHAAVATMTALLDDPSDAKRSCAADWFRVLGCAVEGGRHA